MEIDFADAVRHVGQQIENARLRHRTAPGDTKEVIVDDDAGTPQAPAQQFDPEAEQGCGDALRERAHGTGMAKRRLRLGRHAHRAQAIVAADGDDEPGDGGMKMHVLVRVDVIELEAGGAEGLELRANLDGELTA